MSMFEVEGAIVSFFFLKELRLYTSNNLLLAAVSNPLCDETLEESVDLLYPFLATGRFCPGYYGITSTLASGD
jgi:hypothetical protein